MSLQAEITCPLGSKCEEIKDNKLFRCAWSIELAGRNPNTGEEQNERGCAMAWVPILLIENSQQQKGTAAAVESFRNEMVSANNTPIPLAALFARAGQSISDKCTDMQTASDVVRRQD